MISALDQILTATQAKPSGSNKWFGHCPAHGSKNHPDLSIRVTNDRILAHCFCGCLPKDILAAIGLEMRDLFLDQVNTDPMRRKAAAEQRQRDRLQREIEQRRHGRRIDVCREAERFIQSRSGLDVSQWSAERLDRELNLLADAYQLLEHDPYATC